ncbi:RrF2 family transcriptional regulator [Treponema sp.]|uniref:RrF2 family transcriptional regulator n=1 Tax=Treponema sp. TaxID=166 RepID=UPI003F01E32F
MLKISTKGQYALATMEALAEQNTESYTPLKKLSHKLNLSEKYLEQILISLSKSGLIEGLRGQNGGYRLVKKKQDYTVGEILRAMEGDLVPRTMPALPSVKSPGTEEFWADFNKLINDYVDSVSLEKISQTSKKNDNYIYCI